MAGHAIETHGLTRRFGRLDAVNGLDLAVPEGSIFALVGPNGAGKTTTIKLLMNLIRAHAGSAAVLGTDTRHIGPPVLQRIGYVSENQRLPDWMTPSQLMDFCKPFYPTWDDGLAKQLAVDLELDRAAPLRSLSRGTRMKAALLSSLAYRPELVILDEPFTGLDPVVRDELIRALLEMPAEKQWTVFVSSHDIEEIERLADWVGFMDQGRLVFAEPVASLQQRFRLVEAVANGSEAPAFVPIDDTWLEGSAGRTLRFVDAAAVQTEREAQLNHAYPGCVLQSSPLSLREIFVALMRRRPAVARRSQS